MRAPKLTAVAAAAVLLAGCRSVETRDTYAAQAREGMGPAPTGTAGEAPFGPACAGFPSGPAVAEAKVATVVENSPPLSTLAAALKRAGLTGPLNAAKDITVFAPTNATFDKAPNQKAPNQKAPNQKAPNEKAPNETALDRDTLAYHVVPERLGPANLAGRHRTLQGATIDVVGNGTDFLVDAKARIVCGNVRTANATVYLIDAVLTPARGA